MREITVDPPVEDAVPNPGGAQGESLTPEMSMQRLLLMSLPWVCQSVYVGAKIGIADHLDESDPMPIAEGAVR